MQRIFLSFAILYLLIPNVFFLFGWTNESYAVIATLFLGICFMYICRYLPNAITKVFISSLSKWDWISFAITLLIGLLVVDIIGFHGHFKQSSDLLFRNALYGQLQHDFPPIINPEGHYLIYYFGFFLIPAFLANTFARIFSPEMVLFLYTLAGLWLSLILLFYRLKKLILPFFIFFLLFGTSNNLLCEPHIMRWLPLLAPSQLRYTASGIAQFWCTFNHAVPVFLFCSLLLTRRLSFPILLFSSALLPIFSPFGAFASLPILIIYFFKYKAHEKKYLIGAIIVCIGTIPLLLAHGLFLSSCASSSAHLIWRTADYEWKPLHYIAGNILSILIGFTELFLLLFVFFKHCKNTFIPCAAFAIFFIITQLWMGGSYHNELLYKGYIYINFLLAIPFAVYWKVKKHFIKKIIYSSILLFFSYYSTEIIINAYKSCSFLSPSAIQSNIANGWHGHLIHPEHDWYIQYWSKERGLPIIFKKKYSK